MSTIKDWLIAPLLELEQQVHKETGTRPRLEMTVHPVVFAAAVEAADTRGAVRPSDSVDGALYFGRDIAIRAWPQVRDRMEQMRGAAAVGAIGGENEDIRAALAEALDAWQAKNDMDYTEWRMYAGDDSPRIAELRAKFLVDK